MSKVTIKVIYEKNMKLMLIDHKDFSKLISQIKTSFEIKENYSINLLHANSGDLINSIDQILEFNKKGQNKYNANLSLEINNLLLPMQGPISPILNALPPLQTEIKKEEDKKLQNTDKQPILNEKIPVEQKSESTSIIRRESKDFNNVYKINPEILTMLFQKLLSNDGTVVAIMDFIKANKKLFFKGEYDIKDYSDSLKSIEKTMQDAIKNNIFLMGSFDSGEETKDDKKTEQKNDNKKSAFDNIDVEKSIFEP